MIAAAQAMQHYEIARYGTIVSWAHILGLTDAADLLDETLFSLQMNTTFELPFRLNAQ